MPLAVVKLERVLLLLLALVWSTVWYGILFSTTTSLAVIQWPCVIPPEITAAYPGSRSQLVFVLEAGSMVLSSIELYVIVMHR